MLWEPAHIYSQAICRARRETPPVSSEERRCQRRGANVNSATNMTEPGSYTQRDHLALTSA